MDVLLGDKLELARVCGAEVDSSLVLPRPCGVSDLDWCVIFANALDNAIQACAGMEGTTSIRMAGEQQGSFYLLEYLYSQSQSGHGYRAFKHKNRGGKIRRGHDL